MFMKFASAVILDAHMGTDAGFAKGAHRAVFNYTPRPGYLYVRSRAISSRCNDNFDMFPAEEIEKSWRTFIGKPVFVNHHNEDHRRMRGLVIDAALHRDRLPNGTPDTWTEVLMEIDAVKFPKLAEKILKKEIDRTSMGCDVQFSKCSVCSNVATSPLEYCNHIPGKKGKRILKVQPDGRREAVLVYEICSGLSFFENSLLVEQPADPTAFFLGEVEYGPGLESMVASVSKTAMNKTASHRHPIEHQSDACNDYRPGFYCQQDKGHEGPHVSASGDVEWDHADGPARRRNTFALDARLKEASWTGNNSNSIWDLISLATREVTSGRTVAEEGEDNDHVRSFEGRPVPDHGDRVAVYRDLSGAPKSGYPARGSWSIKRLSERGGRSPHVHAHTVGMHITDASPVYDEGARKKFMESGTRGVHAYIGGHVHHYDSPDSKPIGDSPREVSYYPDLGHFFMKDTRNKFVRSDHAAFLGGKMYASGNIEEDHEGGPMPQSKFEQPKTGSVWNLIYEAEVSGDDIYDWEILHKTAGQAEAEDYLRMHPIGVHHILNRVRQAAADPHVTHSGMRWYDDAHGMAKTMASHHGVPLQHVAGALGVYSASSAPAPNFHMASLALHNKRGIYSQKDKETGEQKGYLGDNYDLHGAPMASHTDAKKVDRMFAGEHYNDVIGSSKTKSYARLIHEPNNHHDVVIDRHAVAAAVGHEGKSGTPYNAVAGAMENQNKGDRIYDRFANAYREATHHINNHPEFEGFRQHLRNSGLLSEGEQVKPHHTQALAWIVQKKISDSHGHDMTRSNQNQIDKWQNHYTERYGTSAHHPASGAGFYGQEPTVKKSYLAKLWKTVFAYGETKAPQDVDTLRAENCTVCGNSTAFDGVQCQICGYVAPPRPFGDPDTEMAKSNDMRKQVLDSADGTADPNDPEQQLGNQIGDPDILDEQAEEVEEEGVTPALTCDNCGTSITPPPAESTGGEPPFPAEGDACPVCNKGMLAADSNGEADEEMEEDEDGDGIPDDEEEPDPDESDDDDEDSGPPKKVKKKQ